MSMTNREGILQALLELDDWNFLSTIQEAILEKNRRNKNEHKLPPSADNFTFLSFGPAQYVVALRESSSSDAAEGDAIEMPQLRPLAMHSAAQISIYLGPTE